MKKLCPFKKKIFYDNRVFGQGYAAPVFAEEEFCDCVEEECGIWNDDKKCCSLKSEKAQLFSDEFLNKLP